jgi:hypothetical protein
MSKPFIELHTQIEGKDCKYVGRFLGFIKDDEFNALIDKPGDVGVKLESKATQPIMDIISNFDNMAGYRLIMTVKKINDTTTLKKLLYITEGLDLVVEVAAKTSADKKVTFQSKNSGNIVVRETD